MASMKKEPTTSLELATLDASAIETLAPELFNEGATSIVDELDGVWNKEQCPTIVGVISHAYSWTTAEGDILYGLAMKTRAPTAVRSSSGQDHVAPAGSIVGITLTRRLRSLLYLRPGDVLAIRYLGEVPLPGGHRAHQYQVRSSRAPRDTPMTETV